MRRHLRRDETDAERLLWRQLALLIPEYKFRRQHSVGPFVLDFYCPSRRLCVEVDGDGHARREQVLRDEERRIRALRFSNSQVLTETESVLEEILRTLTQPSPAAAGEGLSAGFNRSRSEEDIDHG